VREEGHADGFWEERVVVPALLPMGQSEDDKNERVEIGDHISAAQNVAEDIARVRQEGFEVDDDNELLPENIPSNGDALPSNLGLLEGQVWGWDGVDLRITMGGEL
jgi:hypothetical protein